MAKQQFLDLAGVNAILSGLRKETSDIILDAYSHGLRVRLMSEVDGTKESEEGCLYIDASDVKSPKLKIGDGKAFIVDLPTWDLGYLGAVVNKLKKKSITADIDQETLLLPYIYE